MDTDPRIKFNLRQCQTPAALYLNAMQESGDMSSHRIPKKKLKWTVAIHRGVEDDKAKYGHQVKLASYAEDIFWNLTMWLQPKVVRFRGINVLTIYITDYWDLYDYWLYILSSIRNLMTFFLRPNVTCHLGIIASFSITIGYFFDHRGHRRSQWDMVLYCNDVSHWLSPPQDWSPDWIWLSVIPMRLQWS